MQQPSGRVKAYQRQRNPILTQGDLYFTLHKNVRSSCSYRWLVLVGETCQPAGGLLPGNVTHKLPRRSCFIWVRAMLHHSKALAEW